MDDYATAIICAPVWPEFEEPAASNGSIIEACHDCGCDVWVSPNAQAMRAEHDAILRCMDCGFKFMEANGGVDLMNTSAEDAAALKETWKRLFKS